MSDANGCPRVTVSFGLSKKKRNREPAAAAAAAAGAEQQHRLAQVFETARSGQGQAPSHDRLGPPSGNGNDDSGGPPLVIPVAENRFSLAGGTTAAPAVDSLPDAPDASEDSDAFARVPVSQFGAAMLRGMGWKGDDHHGTGRQGGGDKDDDDDDVVLPRPHRLGLGATPQLPSEAEAPPTHAGGAAKRPRRPDQVQRDAALAQQRAEFERERQKRLAGDKQRTLQNGSLVHVAVGDDDAPEAPSRYTTTRRARIVKLVGVPGLNRVQIQWEAVAEYTIVQRRQIQGLVSRDELERKPFREATAIKAEGPPDLAISSVGQEQTKVSQPNKIGSGKGTVDEPKERRGVSLPGNDHDRHRKKDSKHRDKHVDSGNGSSSKRLKTDARQEPSSAMQWVIANIRVRIVSEKYGRKHYQRKGIVLDVTPKGATIQMDDTGALLDHVPERHLETALPKAGGKAVVLARRSPHFMAKGTLLERNSAKGRGVIQIQDDMAVETLSLDDLAEWCGPLDDDEGFGA